MLVRVPSLYPVAQYGENGPLQSTEEGDESEFIFQLQLK
jgi:hypothetical protein